MPNSASLAHNTTAHHHHNTSKLADPSTASFAFQIPGHAIYMANPQRLAVLSLNINATTTITTSRAVPTDQQVLPPPQLLSPRQPVSPLASSIHPPSPNAYRRTSASKTHSPHPPPSSFIPSFRSSSRTRPLSLDFGQKARDALTEFGRLASRRTSAMERANGAETLARVANGLNANASSSSSGHARRASLQPYTDHQQSAPLFSSLVDDSSHLHLASGDAVVLRSSSTCNFDLTPHRDPRFNSQVVPLGIQSIVRSDATPSQPAPIEFVSEPASALASASAAASAPNTLDPSQLLLKVRPPAELARHSWSKSASFLTANNANQYDTLESHAVTLRFRLRLCGSGTTPTSPSFSRANGMNTSSPDQGLGQVLFLSAASPQKLAEAINSPQSTIATAELASLEGISRVQVVSASDAVTTTVARGPRDCDFDWTWKSIDRSASSNGSRCCCAFVEMRPERNTATVLAAMSVHIEMPLPLAAHSSLLASANVSTPSKRGMSRADSLSLFAALNLDQDLSSPRSESATLGSNARAVSGAIDPSSSQNGQQLLHDVDPIHMLIDRTELSLEDLVNDSPIFRAAVGNLERRTASMKRSSKAVLKAAQEARLRILKLVEAEDAMDLAFDGLVGMAPETLGRLQDQFLRQARARIAQHRREQADVIETCLERPLSQIAELCRVAQEGFKLFEAESKTYYSQTQKWLANRSNADIAPFASGYDDAPSSMALKQDRSDEKQKLRELRFEQARLDLYAMLQRLHGGRAEAHLAQCILQLSQWLADLPSTLYGPDWTGQEQIPRLLALDAGLRIALDDHAVQLEQVESRSRCLGDRIRSLEAVLGKAGDADIDIVGAHRFEIEQEAPLQTSTNGAVASKARKFKSFLGVFAAGINNSPLSSSKGTSPNPEAAEFNKQGEPHAASIGEQTQKVDMRRRLSLKLKSDRGQHIGSNPRSPLNPQAPTSWKFDNASATPCRGTELQDTSRPKSGDAVEHLGDGWQSSPHAARTASDAASSAAGVHEVAAATDSDKGLGIFAPASPTTARAIDRSATTASSSIPNPVPGDERKKEGVLWAMVRSIAGPAGADAPRGLNRSSQWRECWIVLSGDGHISEFADWKNAKVLEPTNSLIDLRFATVREARGVDRRFAFEIVTRDSRRFFQAADEESMKDWMRAISKAIESLLNGTSSVRKLDRAIRASPFRNLDPAQRTGTFDENEEELGAEEGNDFAVRRLLDRTGKAFSQSMTDLSASGKTHGGERKDHPKIGAHLATLSEGYAESSARLSKRKPRHERGISNKTPISGYLVAGGLGLSAVDAAALHNRDGTGVSDDGSTCSMSANGEYDTEFDRQIEAVIQRSYGSQDDGTSHSGFSNSSANHIVDEMGKFKGSRTLNGSGRSTSSTFPPKTLSAWNGSVASATTSTKMSRSAEIAAISRQPENSRCADCQESDPRWASWMLTNEPCCIFICIDCSGVHRSLGVHISKVKSVDLDDWTEEQVQAARDWGNAKANAIWEHLKPAGLLPRHGDRKEFWRLKYVEQIWKAPVEIKSRPPQTNTTPAAQHVRSEQAAVVEDVDATPTRGSAQTADATSVSPEKRNRNTEGLRLAPTDQPTVPTSPRKLAEDLGSPKPNGPRPLPNRRSVSTQSIPTISPPQSPSSAELLVSMDHSLRRPISSAQLDQLDWPIQSSSHNRPGDDHTQVTAIPQIAAQGSLREQTGHREGGSSTVSMPVSASVPHLSSMACSTPHVSSAMMAARADPRLFPSSHLQSMDTKAQFSSPTSSFFLSNLKSTEPSPIFFDRPEARKNEHENWDSTSQIHQLNQA
nr:adp-ribosylation factor gtpase activating protein effector [Melanopsichium pennsylvanicum 4]